MFDLTGQPILILSVTLAIALPILVVVLWTRTPRSPRRGPSRLLAPVGRAGLVVLAQFTAMAALFFSVNNQYGFYSSWADLLGTGGDAPARIPVSQVQGGVGTAEVLSVHAQSGVTADTLIWLPPGYKTSGTTRYPVVMFLPGQPSHPQHLFNQYDFGNVAGQAIASGRVKPFVAVFPPIMVAPPRDTECVDVPSGPQAETWLTTDVPAAVQANYRVEPPGKQWSLLGWSTGGLCATKLLLKHPSLFSAAVSFGGAYEPYLDNTTGDLFGGSTKVRNENSPLWLYQTYGMRGTRLLMVAGKQDSWSWASTQTMALAAHGDAAVSTTSFPTGGHNYRNYKAYLGPALEWLAKSGAVG